MKDYYQSLFPETFYHIYNRGNNKENIFYQQKNYHYFLKKYDHYLSDYLETYAFCLLPNHFHLLVKVKSSTEISDLIALSDKIANNTISNQIIEQFRRFFLGYAQAINKQQGRAGSLFQKKFKRLAVTNQRYLTNLIYYIHANPQYHGVIEDFRSYAYSSYNKFLIVKRSKLKKAEVIAWFGSIEQYQLYHNIAQGKDDWEAFLIED